MEWYYCVPVILSLPEKGELVSYFLFCIIVMMVAVVVMMFKLDTTASKKPQKGSVIFAQLPSLPVIGVLHHVFLNRNDIGTLLVKWRHKYGPCWRTKVFGKDIFLIHDPSLLKLLFESGDVGHLEKFAFMYNILFIGAANNGLVSLRVQNWIPHRKALNSLFTYEALKNYIKIFKKHADQLVQDLNCEGSNKRKSNVCFQKFSYDELVHVRTLDIIAEIAIGVPLKNLVGQLGCLDFHKHMKTIREIISDKVFAKPWQIVPLIWYFHPMSKKLNTSVRAIETTVHMIRKLHIPEPKSNKFALDLMINANWSDAEITSELLTLLVAGHETVSSNFILHLWLLALEQDHQFACQKEVDQLFDTLEASGQELTLSSLTQLKYLERCIKESLRLFPSTPFGTGRELKSPLKLGKDLIMETGSVIMYSTFILHRDPSIYPNPETFDPNRFLPENVKSRSVYEYLPFSAGSRNCLGWKMASLELTILSAVMLRNFHLHTTDTREDIKIMFSHILYPAKQPNIIFQRRR